MRTLAHTRSSQVPRWLTLNLKKVHFFWVCRSQESLKWFTEIIAEVFLMIMNQCLQQEKYCERKITSIRPNLHTPAYAYAQEKKQHARTHVCTHTLSDFSHTGQTRTGRQI
eukprot:Tamp_14333.p2 GENE.Tamp_14333~~Tamp_14333.p2  ORF type:complete len:111 (+),score=8.83 Tamp_14333:489-821(+)